MISASSSRRSSVQFAHASDQRGALLDRRSARPLAVRPIGRRDRVRELRITDRQVRLD